MQNGLDRARPVAYYPANFLRQKEGSMTGKLDPTFERINNALRWRDGYKQEED